MTPSGDSDIDYAAMIAQIAGTTPEEVRAAASKGLDGLYIHERLDNIELWMARIAKVLGVSDLDKGDSDGH